MPLDPQRTLERLHRPRDSTDQFERVVVIWVLAGAKRTCRERHHQSVFDQFQASAT
jgi:hypothetical protein